MPKMRHDSRVVVKVNTREFVFTGMKPYSQAYLLASKKVAANLGAASQGKRYMSAFLVAHHQKGDTYKFTFRLG